MHSDCQQHPLFSGADLTALFERKPDARGTLVAFACAANAGGLGKTLVGGALAKALPLNILTILSKHNHWYQTAELNRIGEVIAEVPEIRDHRRIGYGVSMGGYGALLATRPFRLHDIVAVCPQTVLDDAIVPLTKLCLESLARNPILHDDVPDAAARAERVRLIFDPLHRRDRRHAAYLRARLPSVELLPVPGFDHPPLAPFRKAGILTQVWAGLLAGGLDARAFREARRAVRSGSYDYWRRLAQLATDRRHHAIARHAAERALALLQTERAGFDASRCDAFERQRDRLAAWHERAGLMLARRAHTARGTPRAMAESRIETSEMALA